MKAYLALENGVVLEGESIGAAGETVGEIVFNTGMTGYQEVLTDPSYAGQIVTMTYPLIGNYGITQEDMESAKSYVQGFIVRELCDVPSNWRSEGDLNEFLRRQNIVGISGIDTRALTKILRESGTMNGIITTKEPFSLQEYQKQMENYRITDPVSRVTCQKPRVIEGPGPKVALLDFGAKENIVRSLAARGCHVTVLPALTKPEEILGHYDGVMLSNGPGDPKDCGTIVEGIRELIRGSIPIFGICLGHQLTALAFGADTGKLKYGHRGANHPVTDRILGRTYITSQNHGYAVLEDSLDQEIAQVTHVNGNDGTVEGIAYKNRPIFTVQFHPEASPGPKDTAYLFDRFISMMGGKAHA